jgi:cyclopropane fatty-acyl-phospholipid synthase-like methyltransferase
MDDAGSPKNPVPDIFRYYLELGTLFEEISERSGYMNFGYLEADQKTSDVSFAQHQLIRKVAEKGDFRKGMAALDVGCGLGGPAAQVFHEFGCDVTGMDPGPFQRNRLRSRMAKPSGDSVFKAVSGDALDLPFRPMSFDRIYSVESAFHYADKRRFIRESSRVLKRDGLLIIADILQKSGRGRSRLGRTLMDALAAPQLFDADRYREAAGQSGLKLLRADDISPGVRRAMRLWRRNFYRKWPVVRKHYSFMTLVKIGIALTLTPVLAPLAPFHYVILVFGFDESRS